MDNSSECARISVKEGGCGKGCFYLDRGAFVTSVGVTWVTFVVIPPRAVAVYVAKTITGDSIGVIYRGVLPFLLRPSRCLMLLFVFPGLTTFLSSLVMD
jgi:TRAP-type mannitol/chloroaromatic compound transport system permease large subunit